jgi:hypothetical protein
MFTQDELKERLFAELEKRPEINTFFGPMIRARVSQPQWLENGLVLLLLRNVQEQLSIIGDFLGKVKAQQSGLFGQMMKQLKGTEPDFDARLNDLLAELNALSWIVDEKFIEIEKLKRGTSKTPDFRAKKEGTNNLFEVKNLQVPDELLTYVLNQLEIRQLLNPDLYNTNFFKVNVSFEKVPGDFPNDTDKLHVHRFIDEIEDTIRSGKQSAMLCYSKSIGDRQVKKTLKCKWDFCEHFAVMGHSSDYRMRLDDPLNLIKLLPLLRKTWEHVSRAVEQLLEYDKEDSFEKWILINWQKPPNFEFDDMLSGRSVRRFVRCINAMEDILSAINPKLHIHLL